MYLTSGMARPNCTPLGSSCTEVAPAEVPNLCSMPRFSLATASRALTHSPSGLRYIGSAIDRSKAGAIRVFLLQASSFAAISDLSTSGDLPFGTRRLTASLKALSSIPT
ncbi:hypothetical protein D3C71_1663300 [compost metagenome]